MTDHPLSAAARRLELDFLVAAGEGSSELTAFNDRLALFVERIRDAQASSTLPEEVIELATATLRSIITQAEHLYTFASPTENDATPADDFTESARLSSASLPLFRYIIDNICYPYPDSEEKERLVDAAREAGWSDFDKKKCEDWLNRRRHQSGFVAISRKFCNEDNDAMRVLCRIALFGTAEEKARLDPVAVQEVEEMRAFLHSQYDELCTQERTGWVDDLARGLVDVLDESAVNDSAWDSSDEDNYDHYEDCLASESDFDSDSSGFDTDEDDLPRPTLLGSKRKSMVLYAPAHRYVSQPDYSSDSSRSVASFRSFSGISSSSASSLETDDDDNDHCRAMKRRRNECKDVDVVDGSNNVRDPTLGSTSALELWLLRNPSFSGKRKYSDEDITCHARQTKRRRVSVNSTPLSCISDVHVNALAEACQLDWQDPAPVDATVDADIDAYTVDCTAVYETNCPSDDVSDQLAACLVEYADAPDCSSRAELHLRNLHQSLATLAQHASADDSHESESFIPEVFVFPPSNITATNGSTRSFYDESGHICAMHDNAQDACSPPALIEDSSSCYTSPSAEPLAMCPPSVAVYPILYEDVDPFPLAFGWSFGTKMQVTFDPDDLHVQFSPPPETKFGPAHLDIFSHYISSSIR